VPLRLGSGTRLKIVEALAMAKGVVSTHLGAEGLETEHGRHILLADEPDRFADHVVRLLEDPAAAERLGEAGRRLAVERYAWSAAAGAMEALYRRVIAARRAS
jgi:polysaccharide biosynthesis protein PslH